MTKSYSPSKICYGSAQKESLAIFSNTLSSGALNIIKQHETTAEQLNTSAKQGRYIQPTTPQHSGAPRRFNTFYN